MRFRGTIPLGSIVLLATALTWMASSSSFAAPKHPHLRADESWITIRGTVKNVAADQFTLDYGAGEVTVEMDDGDRDADAYKLVSGDEVTVNGAIDDDLFETTKIEASSVYVDKLGTYFYSSPVDEEDHAFYSMETPGAASTIVRGTVTKVDAHEFTIDTGLRSLRIEVAQLGNDPLDEDGYQRIRKGDYVKVTGAIDDSFFEGRELMAQSVVKLAS